MGDTAKRIYYFDILRSMACIMVIGIHTATYYISNVEARQNFAVGTCWHAVFKIAVPLFVMISGALMLDENYLCTAEKLWGHIKKMAIFFLFWSAVYATVLGVRTVLRGGDFSPRTFIRRLGIGHYHLWFCYMIAGLYLLIPVLRLWVKKQNRRVVEYFLVLGFIFTALLPQLFTIGTYFLPQLKWGNDLLGRIDLQYVGGYLIYFVLGWYLRFFDLRHRRLAVVGGLCGLSVCVIFRLVLSLREGQLINVYNDTSAGIFLWAVAVFLLIKNRFENRQPGTGFLSRAVMFVSENSLGVYAVHAGVLSAGFRLAKQQHMTTAWILCPVLLVVTAGISLLLSYLLSKIPLLKRVV